MDQPITPELGRVEGFRPERLAQLFNHVGPKSMDRLRAFTAALDDARKRRDAAQSGSPERELLDLEVRSHELAVEIFLDERDNTGSLIGERLGQDLDELFRSDELEQEGVRIPGRRLELDPKGNLIASPDDAKRHFLLFTMGELDRFNREGGHAGGDTALQESVKTVEDRVRAALRGTFGEAINDKYEVYRFGANDFVVTLREVDSSFVEQLQQDIASPENWPTPLSGRDPAPISATRFDLASTVSLMNEAQRLARDHAIPVLREEEMPRAMIDLIRMMSSVDTARAQFRAQCERVQKKLKDKPGETESFFRQYMQAKFQGLNIDGLTSLDDFHRAAEAGRLEELVQKGERQVISQWVAKRATDASERKRVLLASIAEERRVEPAPIILPPKEIPAVPMPETEARGLLAQVEQAAEEARQALTRAEEAGEAHEIEKAKLSLRIAELNQERESVRRDRLTGLLKRRPFYSELQNQIAEDRQGGVLFVDMAFLKYFDREGGPEVGDRAILQAASLLEQAIGEAELADRASVHRYGGDEFTIRYEGGEEDVSRLRQVLHEISGDKSLVPRGPRSTDRYSPAGLYFNTGHVSVGVGQELFDELTKRGLISAYEKEDPALRAKRVAELTTMAADLLVDRTKAENRLYTLFEKRKNDDPAWKTLLAYSEKAIGGKEGEEFLDRLYESDLDLERARPEIGKFVDDLMRKLGQERETMGLIFDALVESFANEQVLKERIAMLERDLAEAETDKEQLLGEIKSLNAELAALREARARIEKLEHGT